MVRQSILGVEINAVNMMQTLEAMENWIANREPHYICCVPAHILMDCRANPSLIPILNASGINTPDGMAVVWYLRVRGHRNVTRVYGPDLMLAFCERSVESGTRHYLYGGAEGVAETLATKLKNRFPGIQVVGMDSPPFRELTAEEDQGAVKRIRAARPDIVWVGIGSPRQERWMAEHVHRLDVPVLVGVGAAFDFLSGNKAQAPYWMQRSGLEWLFRLCNEPRRLWRRYLQYPRFAVLALWELIFSRPGG